MRHLMLLAACAALIPATSARAQSASLRLPELMTREEMDAVGVDSLSPAQRAALERFLERYSASIAKALREAAPTAMPPNRSTSATTLRLRRVGERGEAVVLDDGSVWKVDAAGRAIAAQWRSGQHVLVRHRAGEPGAATFELENAQAGTRVVARFAGTLEPPAPPPPPRSPSDDPRMPVLWSA